jgi:hypothetical protein
MGSPKLRKIEKVRTVQDRLKSQLYGDLEALLLDPVVEKLQKRLTLGIGDGSTIGSWKKCGENLVPTGQGLGPTVQGTRQPPRGRHRKRGDLDRSLLDLLYIQSTGILSRPVVVETKQVRVCHELLRRKLHPDEEVTDRVVVLRRRQPPKRGRVALHDRKLGRGRRRRNRLTPQER